MAGIDFIKLGYVARSHPRDPHHHVILSTQVGSQLDRLHPPVASFNSLTSSVCAARRSFVPSSVWGMT